MMDILGNNPGLVLATGAAITLGGLYFYCAGQEEKIHIPSDLNLQSEQMEGPEMIRCSRVYKDAKDGKFMKYLYEDGKTVYEAFRRGAKESNDGRCLGWRDGPGLPYQWLNYNEALLRAHNFGSGLVSLGLSPGTETRVGIFAQNCVEWVLAEQSLYHYSMVVVPLYDTYGPEACSYILEHAQLSTVVCDSDAKVNFLLDKRPPPLKRIILMKEIPEATKLRGQKLGIAIIPFEEVERIGAAKNQPPVPPKAEDVCTICFTSGTTGKPKGVILSHGNVIACVSAVLHQLGNLKPNPQDVMISFLPLAHMLERCCQVAIYMTGGCVGFWLGNVRGLADDMKALKPTLMPAVPRILNRIHDTVWSKTNRNFFKRNLIKLALRSKEKELRRGVIRYNSIWDKLVFSKVREGTGGCVRLIVVGSAPLAGNVLTFIRCALGCIVVEGYGQSELVAPCTLTFQGDWVPEHVGPPLPCVHMKLVDVPEMEYYASVGQGEICVRGSTVFQGYFQDVQRTKDTIDPNGWVHTGDIGMWLPNGTLKIVDRKKHIFKLSQGEYIAPEKIENIYQKSEFVSQLFIHGESLKSCVVGIVVPDVEVLKRYASDNGIEGTFSVLCSMPEIKQIILEDMLQLGRENNLKSFEQVKDIYLHPDPFSIQNGLLTPTLKAKRPELRKYFHPQIDDMYSRLA